MDELRELLTARENEHVEFKEAKGGFEYFVGERGVYTRLRGLDQETNKALLLRHIEDNGAEGSPLEELRQVLPALSEGQIKVLLRTLRAAGAIHARGRTRAGRWFPGPDPHRSENQRGDSPNESQFNPNVQS